MDIQVTTPAASHALLTVAAMKSRLGIADADTSKDTRVQELIDAISAAAVTHFGLPLVYQGYRVKMAGSGRQRLLLPRRPLDREGLEVRQDDELLDDVEISNAQHGELWRELGFPVGCAPVAETGEDRYQIDLFAGHVPPAKLRAWSAAATLSVGDWVAPTNPAVSGLFFRVTTGGVTGGTEPSWPTVPGVFPEGAIEYVATDVPRVPHDILRGAIFAVVSWYRMETGAALAGVKRDKLGPHEIEYHDAEKLLSALGGLPKPTESLWNAVTL